MANSYLLQVIDKKTTEDYYGDGIQYEEAKIIRKAIEILANANPNALVGLMEKLNKSEKDNYKISKAANGLASAYYLSCDPEIYKNHINSLGRGSRLRNANELADAIKRDRPEVSKLLNKIGMGKKDKPEGYSESDVVLIKDLFQNYKNIDQRVEAFKSRNKKLTIISESDLVIRSSKKLKRLNKKTGLLD